MKEFLIYLFKSGLCLSIFLLIYRLLLRQTTFFKLNRVFLISGLFISFLIPSIDYTYDVITASAPTVTPINEKNLYASPTLSTVSEVDVDYSDEEPVVTTKTKNTLMIRLGTIWTVLFCVYIFIVLLLVVRNIVTQRNLFSLTKQGNKTKYESYKMIDSPVIDMPFTVFNTIYADMNKISGNEVKTSILKHEVIHIKQRHWVDLIFGELALILQWFNPVMWVYIRSLKENHEFLADKGVLEQGISPDTYRAVLINERLQGKVFNLSSPFKGTGTLGRLSMMKKEKTSAWKTVLALSVVPLLGIFLWMSAEPNYLLLNLDSFSVSMIGKVTTVDKDGYPIEDGLSSRDVLYLSKMASYEGAIPASLRTKNLDLYAKRGKDGTLVVNTKKNSNVVKNLELINRVEVLDDLIILIDGKASSAEELKALNIKDMASLSYLINNRMLALEGDIITVSLISGTGVNYPKLLKTDNLDVALSETLSDVLTVLTNPSVIIRGKQASVNELKNTKLTSINVMSVFTKPDNVKKYTKNNSVIMVK